MKITRKTLVRMILVPFLLHWVWWLFHYAGAMKFMIDQGLGTTDTAPVVYLVVQSWVLLSEIMIMVILFLLALTVGEELK